MEDKKNCTKCGKLKSLDLFNKQSITNDGLTYACKDCLNAYDRGYIGKNKDKATSKIYSQSEAGKKSSKRNTRLKRKRHPMQYRATAYVMNHIRRGNIVRPMACSTCLCECKPEAHHCDYSKPLDVTFLCKSCHMEWHKNNKALNNE